MRDHVDKVFMLALGLTLTGVGVGIEIRSMTVPPVVESGTRLDVILECNYDHSKQEAAQMDVKWFFGDDPQPFFQWLPGRPPQAIGDLFRNRIDLSYKVAGANKYREHSAIRILRPTTELSGKYKCKVSSFVDEDFMTKSMVVYSPAKEVSLIYTKPEANLLNLTCSVQGVYPEPEIKLTWGPRNPGPNDRSEETSTTTLTVERNNLFDVTVYKWIDEAMLKPETVFGCEVNIPGTSFSIREETMYFPGRVLYQITSASASEAVAANIVVSLILGLLLRRFS